MPLTSGFSFCRDEVQTRLLSEVWELRDNVTALQDMLSEVCSTWNVSNKNVNMITVLELKPVTDSVAVDFA